MSLYPWVHLFKCSSRMMAIPPRSISGCRAVFHHHWQSHPLCKWLTADQIVPLFFSRWFEGMCCVDVRGLWTIKWEDDRYMSSSRAAVVCMCALEQSEQLTKWIGGVTECQYRSSSPQRTWTNAQSKSLIPPPSPLWSLLVVGCTGQI